MILVHMKMSKRLSAKYNQENKERLQRKIVEDIKNLSKEEKEKKKQYRGEHYKNLSEDDNINIAKNIIE